MQIDFLYSALKEAQDNIRTYDTKAQIVGIGFIFTIGLVFKIQEALVIDLNYNAFVLAVVWILIIGPAIFFGAVLYPTRKVAPKVLKNKEKVKSLFYMNLHEVENVDQYVKHLETMDIEQELAYEMLKVSYLRDLKRKHFLKALSAASMSLGAQFVLLLLSSLKMI